MLASGALISMASNVSAHAETVNASVQSDMASASDKVTTDSGLTVSTISGSQGNNAASSSKETDASNSADANASSKSQNDTSAEGEKAADSNSSTNSVSSGNDVADDNEASSENKNSSDSGDAKANSEDTQENDADSKGDAQGNSEDAKGSAQGDAASENATTVSTSALESKSNDDASLLSASLLTDTGSTATIKSLSEAKNYSNYDHSAALTDLETAKASYKKGESVPVSFAFANSTNSDQKITATMTVYYGVNPIGEIRSVSKYLKAGEAYDVATNATDQNQFTIDNSWLENNKGYTIQIKVTDASGKQIGLKNLGLAIENDWTKFPRYGVIAGSGSHAYGIPNDPALMQKYAEQIEEMKNMHVNSYFFYDVYKDAANPFPDEESYTQEWVTWTSNKPQISTQAVKDLVAKVHDTNASAMLYNMIHARNTYENTENTPGLPDDSQLMYNAYDGAFGSKGQAMTNSAAAQVYYNPASPAWQKYITQVMIDAMKRGNFDGWNGDTIGDNTVTTSEDKGTDKTFRLQDTYGYFSKNVIDAFKGKKPDGTDYYYTINNVNTEGLKDSLSNVSVAYTELWPSGNFDGHAITEYGDLKNVVDYVRDQSGKSLIVSAYLKNNTIGSDNIYNTNAELLTTASIAAAGGYHMELDANANNNDEYGTGILGNEYYPNQDHKVSEDLNRLLYQYSQFQVQYENMLRGDGETNDIAMAKTYNASGSQVSRDENNSTDAGRNGNQVWTFTKKGDGFKTIQLINLMGINSDWDNTSGNNNKNPEVQKNLTVVYPLGSMTESLAKAYANNVYVTSPDDWNKGTMVKASASVVNNGDGTYSLKVNVPELSLWDMVYIQEPQVAHVTYHDDTDNKDLKSDTLNGSSGSTAYTDESSKNVYTTVDDIKDYLSKGYVLVSDDTSGNKVVFDSDSSKDQNYTVHLKHATTTKSVSDDVTRTVEYKISGGSQQAPASVKDTLHFTGTQTIDSVTQKVVKTDWSANQDFKDITSPAVTGYTPDKVVISNKNIAHDHADIKEVVTYAPDAQKAAVTYIDQTTGKTLAVKTLNGFTLEDSGYNTASSINAYKNLGYDLVSDSTNGVNVIFDDDDATDQAYKVILAHGYATVTSDMNKQAGTPINPDKNGAKWPEGSTKSALQHDVKRNITYVIANGKKTAPASVNDSLHYEAVATVDKVTGQVVKTVWSAPQDFKDIASPAVKGYTADKKSISDKNIAHDHADIKEVVTYSADSQSGGSQSTDDPSNDNQSGNSSSTDDPKNDNPGDNTKPVDDPKNNGQSSSSQTTDDHKNSGQGGSLQTPGDSNSSNSNPTDDNGSKNSNQNGGFQSTESTDNAKTDNQGNNSQSVTDSKINDQADQSQSIGTGTDEQVDSAEGSDKQNAYSTKTDDSKFESQTYNLPEAGSKDSKEKATNSLLTALSNNDNSGSQGGSTSVNNVSQSQSAGTASATQDAFVSSQRQLPQTDNKADKEAEVLGMFATGASLLATIVNHKKTKKQR